MNHDETNTETLEQASERLAKRGYHVCLSRRRTDWTCLLFNAIVPRVPQGNAPTALEAIQVAEDELNRMAVLFPKEKYGA